jgi:hypothetical protein
LVVLPIIDALIVLGWSILLLGGFLKMIHLTTPYRPTLLGMAPMDCMLLSGVLLLFSIALAARTWVKANQPAVLAQRARERAREAMGQFGDEPSEERGEEGGAEPRPARTAAAGR